MLGAKKVCQPGMPQPITGHCQRQELSAGAKQAQTLPSSPSAFLEAAEAQAVQWWSQSHQLTPRTVAVAASSTLPFHTYDASKGAAACPASAFVQHIHVNADHPACLPLGQANRPKQAMHSMTQTGARWLGASIYPSLQTPTSASLPAVSACVQRMSSVLRRQHTPARTTCCRVLWSLALALQPTCMPEPLQSPRAGHTRCVPLLHNL
jgi:hypothetical protein